MVCMAALRARGAFQEMDSDMGSWRIRASPVSYLFHPFSILSMDARRVSPKFLKGLGEASVLGCELGFNHRGAVVGGVSESQAISVNLAALVRFHIRQFHLGLLELLLECLDADGEDVGRRVGVHCFV